MDILVSSLQIMRYYHKPWISWYHLYKLGHYYNPWVFWSHPYNLRQIKWILLQEETRHCQSTSMLTFWENCYILILLEDDEYKQSMDSLNSSYIL